jgi:hypothetical protein
MGIYSKCIYLQEIHIVRDDNGPVEGFSHRGGSSSRFRPNCTLPSDYKHQLTGPSLLLK